MSADPRPTIAVIHSILKFTFLLTEGSPKCLTSARNPENFIGMV